MALSFFSCFAFSSHSNFCKYARRIWQKNDLNQILITAVSNKTKTNKRGIQQIQKSLKTKIWFVEREN